MYLNFVKIDLKITESFWFWTHLLKFVLGILLVNILWLEALSEFALGKWP